MTNAAAPPRISIVPSSQPMPVAWIWVTPHAAAMKSATDSATDPKKALKMTRRNSGSDSWPKALASAVITFDVSNELSTPARAAQVYSAAPRNEARLG